jgi:hypothetical protein
VVYCADKSSYQGAARGSVRWAVMQLPSAPHKATIATPPSHPLIRQNPLGVFRNHRGHSSRNCNCAPHQEVV